MNAIPDRVTLDERAYQNSLDIWNACYPAALDAVRQKYLKHLDMETVRDEMSGMTAQTETDFVEAIQTHDFAEIGAIVYAITVERYLKSEKGLNEIAAQVQIIHENSRGE